MTHTEALKVALEALEEPHPGIRTSFTDAITYREKAKQAIAAIKEALAQQKPVALEAVYETIIQWDEGGGKRSRRDKARPTAEIYTTPPRGIPQAVTQIPQEDSSNESAYQRGYLDGMAKRPQPLTDGQIANCISGIFAERNYWVKFARAIEAAHGIKENT